MVIGEIGLPISKWLLRIPAIFCLSFSLSMPPPDLTVSGEKWTVFDETLGIPGKVRCVNLTRISVGEV